MEYELINPSDPYTFIAKNKETAALVIACLSTAYGAKTKDGNEEIPIFILGGFTEWYKEEFGRDCDAGAKELRDDIADALDSFMYGNFEDRDCYDYAVSCIKDQDRKEEFKAKWNDKRSSLNDIGTYAHNLAKKMKEFYRQ